MHNRKVDFFEKLTAILILMGLIFIAQLPSLNNGFVYDDDRAITVNSLVTESKLADIWVNDIWGTTGAVNSGTYRPIMVTTFALQWITTPNNPFAFHLFNTVLFCICVLLCFFLLKTLIPAKLAWFAAAIFALHPINSEVTHNIIQRSELLATVFVLSYLLLLSEEIGKKITLKRHLFAILCFALALFSKENAVVAPVLLVVLTRFNPQNNNNWLDTIKKTWHTVTVSILVFIGYYALRLMALGAFSRNVPYEFNPTVAFDAIWRHMNTAWLGLRYLIRYFFPLPQPVEWVYNQLPVFGPESLSFMLLIWLVVLVLAFFTIKGLQKRSLLAIGLLWFSIAIFPVIQAFVTVTVLFADRCLFLPGIGLSVAVVAIASHITKRINISEKFTLATAFILLLLMVGYQLHIADRWKDNLTLFTHLTENSPNCANVQRGYGKFLYAAKRYDEAELHLQTAKQISEYSVETWFWLGKIQMYNGKFKDAAENWKVLEQKASPSDLLEYHKQQCNLLKKFEEKILHSDPNDVIQLLNFYTTTNSEFTLAWGLKTIALYNLENKAKFQKSYTFWKSLLSEDDQSLKLFGILYLQQQKYNQASDSFGKYLAHHHDDRQIMYQRAIALAQALRFTEAIHQMKSLMAIDSENQDLKNDILWLELGKILNLGF